MGKGVVALGIIGMILATGAIGFAFVVWNGQNTTNTELNDLTDAFNDLESDFNNLTAILNNLNQTIVVGLWDGLEHNLDFAPYNSQSDWLYEFEYNKLNNTDYISVSNTNTRITLLKPGWYQIHLNVILSSIGTSTGYWSRLLKDGFIEFYFDRLATGGTVGSSYHYIDASGFVYSNGSNYIEVNAYSTGAEFFYTSQDTFNQFMIEYIAT